MPQSITPAILNAADQVEADLAALDVSTRALVQLLRAGQGGGGGGAPFAPDDLANLKVWLDASDASTITESGGAVSQWTDKSANAYAFTQGDGALQPTTGSTTQNSLNTISFNGDYLQHSTASTWNFLHNGTAHTMFLVFKAGTVANPDASYGIIGTHGGSASFPGMEIRWDDRNAVGGRNEMLYHTVGTSTSGNTQNLSSNGFWAPNTHALLTVAADPSNGTAAARSSFTRNSGSAVANNIQTTAATSSDARFPLSIGWVGAITSVYMVGEIAEILIYDATLSAGDVTSVEAYLASKWGITL